MKKEFPFRVLFTDKNAMKKTLLFLLALALCLSGCGRQQVQEAPPPVPEASEAPVYAAPDAAAPAAPAWRYQSVPITADNWTEYFALSELPLYAVTSDGSISQVCQNYCVVLRDEYADRYPYILLDEATDCLKLCSGVIVTIYERKIISVVSREYILT